MPPPFVGVLFLPSGMSHGFVTAALAYVLAQQGISVTAGYVDSAAFLALQALFSAHVTGNFVTLAAALVLGTSGVVATLIALSGSAADPARAYGDHAAQLVKRGRA